MFARVLSVWVDDEEDGLDRTMAALDRGLASAERWAGFVDDLLSHSECVLRGPRAPAPQRVTTKKRKRPKLTGTRTVARNPPIGLSPSVMSPPCERAMSRAIASPKPGAALVLIARIVEPQERLEHLLAHIGTECPARRRRP